MMMNNNKSLLNDDSSSDISFYHNDDESDDISYEEEIRTDFNFSSQHLSAVLPASITPPPQPPVVAPPAVAPLSKRIVLPTATLHPSSLPSESSPLFVPTIEQLSPSSEQNKKEQNTRGHTTTPFCPPNQQIEEIKREQKLAIEQYQLKVKRLQEKKSQLQSKIHNVQSKQTQILHHYHHHHHNREQQSIKNDIDHKLQEYNIQTSKSNHILTNLKCIQHKLKFYTQEREKLNNIHVLHDVFYIFHRGYFATINGLRLGMSAPSPSSSSSLPSTTNTTANITVASLSNQLFQNQLSTATNNNHNTNHNTVDNTIKSATTTNNNNKNNLNSMHSNGNSNDVPWHEINAGIGMIALLISTIQSKLNIRSRFTIIPRGSTSKICFNTTCSTNAGINLSNQQNIFHNSSATTNTTTGGGGGNTHHQEWDLYYTPTTFSFFAKRHWNTALNILGYCLYEVIQEVKSRLEIYRTNSSVLQSNSTIASISSGVSIASIAATTLPTKNEYGINHSSSIDAVAANANTIIDDHTSSTDTGTTDTATTTKRTIYKSLSGKQSTNEQFMMIEIMIPYDVELSGDWKSNDRSIGYVKVGGSEIGYHNDGIAWTKALRYVALDLKWVMAFLSKYVDIT